MFIRNDTSADKEYFNRKVAKISFLDNDGISVILDNSQEEIKQTSETWKQKRYF